MYKQIAASLVLAAAAALPASATTLAPGGDVFNLSQFSAAGLTKLTQSPVTTLSPGTFTSTQQTAVFTDTNNVFCSGCLDFVYNVSNTGTAGIIESISASTFDSFLTNVGYIANGGLVPNEATRSTNGNVVKFYFDPTGIAAGQNANFLVVQTNATNYTTGVFSVQDGSAGTEPGFQPAGSTAVTPEPSSLLMLGTGLLGAAGAARRKLFRA